MQGGGGGGMEETAAAAKNRSGGVGERAAVEVQEGPRLRRVCVFCGSSSGKRSSYRDAAVELGKELVRHQLPLSSPPPPVTLTRQEGSIEIFSFGFKFCGNGNLLRSPLFYFARPHMFVFGDGTSPASAASACCC